MQAGSRGPSLLRSNPSFPAFLAPSFSSSLPVSAVRLCSTYLAIANTAISRRSIQSQPARQASSAAAAAAAPQQPLTEDDGTRTRTDTLPKPQSRSPDHVDRRQVSLLDKFRNSSKNIQAPKTDADRAREVDSLIGKPMGLSSSTSEYYPGESTADMVLRKRAESQREDFATAQGQRSQPGSISRGMKMPPADMTFKYRDVISKQEPTRAVATIKSRPSLGRMVEVMPERGMDLGRALRSLEINCAVNNVKGDQRAQKFHERTGMKRKRLHSLRWRRRFKIGFKAVVGKVKGMRRKGW